MKISGKLAKIIGTAAPLLGTALGGPLGGLAGSMIQQALGVDTEAQAMALIDKDPNALVKLKEAEIDFEKRMRELDIDLEKVAAQDRASARQMATQTTLWPQIVLSVLYTSAYVGLLWTFVGGVATVDPEYRGLVQTLIGALGAAQLTILTFWFGSSAGSARKTDLLKNGH